MDDDSLEPFSLDLDISSDLTGQPEVVEPAVTPESVEESEMDSRKEPESTETTESELQETGGNHEETERDKTLTDDIPLQQEDIDPDSETDADFDTKTRRPQRLKRAPLRFTYDTPGYPSVIAAPRVKYVSCIYKGLGTPIIA